MSAEPAPFWRSLALVALVFVAVAATYVPAAVPFLGESLLPPGLRTEVVHLAAIGGWMIVWGMLSLGVVALAARFVFAIRVRVARRDVVLAAVAVLLLAGWQMALMAWLISKFGLIELDALTPFAWLWPAVVLVSVALSAIARVVHRDVFTVVLAFAAVSIVALALETASSIAGALEDGRVSPNGMVVGVLTVLQVAVLGSWLVVQARERMIDKRVATANSF